MFRYEEGGKGHYPCGDMEDDKNQNPFKENNNDDDDDDS